MPTIAFGGATEVPQEAWALVEGLAPAYGDDWWYGGLLAFIRQEQSRWDDAMELAVASLAAEPASAHAAHARTHVHYETGDHAAGLAWLDGWMTARARPTPSADTSPGMPPCTSWPPVTTAPPPGGYVAQLAPPAVTGVRALVDSASLLWRGHLAGAWGWPASMRCCPRCPPFLIDPPTPFIALHAAVALAAAQDRAGLARLASSARAHVHPAFNGRSPGLTDALIALVDGNPGIATDQLMRLEGVDTLGGSAAQREVVEETLLYCAISARRHELAASLLRARLDRRPSARDANRLRELVGFPAARAVPVAGPSMSPVLRSLRRSSASDIAQPRGSHGAGV